MTSTLFEHSLNTGHTIEWTPTLLSHGTMPSIYLIGTYNITTNISRERERHPNTFSISLRQHRTLFNQIDEAESTHTTSAQKMSSAILTKHLSDSKRNQTNTKIYNYGLYWRPIMPLCLVSLYTLFAFSQSCSNS